mmetsp:Transcript_24656/g.60628  ORF Transcript_24656/g.60628 Transcript_24656/m.60628 type:complete len:231 (-) Transcript_24656:2282-2974(-)
MSPAHVRLQDCWPRHRRRNSSRTFFALQRHDASPSSPPSPTGILPDAGSWHMPTDSSNIHGGAPCAAPYTASKMSTIMPSVWQPINTFSPSASYSVAQVAHPSLHIAPSALTLTSSASTAALAGGEHWTITESASVLEVSHDPAAGAPPSAAPASSGTPSMERLTGTLHSRLPRHSVAIMSLVSACGRLAMRPSGIVGGLASHSCGLGLNSHGGCATASPHTAAVTPLMT